MQASADDPCKKTSALRPHDAAGCIGDKLIDHSRRSKRPLGKRTAHLASQSIKAVRRRDRA